MLSTGCKGSLSLCKKKKTKPRKPSRPQVTLGGHTTKGWEAVHDCLSHLTRVHITWRVGKPYLQKCNKLYPKSHQPERSSDVNIIVGIFPYIYTMLRGKKKKSRLSSILHILRLQYKNIIHTSNIIHIFNKTHPNLTKETSKIEWIIKFQIRFSFPSYHLLILWLFLSVRFYQRSSLFCNNSPAVLTLSSWSWRQGWFLTWHSDVNYPTSGIP